MGCGASSAAAAGISTTDAPRPAAHSVGAAGRDVWGRGAGGSLLRRSRHYGRYLPTICAIQGVCVQIGNQTPIVGDVRAAAVRAVELPPPATAAALTFRSAR